MAESSRHRSASYGRDATEPALLSYAQQTAMSRLSTATDKRDEVREGRGGHGPGSSSHLVSTPRPFPHRPLKTAPSSTVDDVTGQTVAHKRQRQTLKSFVATQQVITYRIDRNTHEGIILQHTDAAHCLRFASCAPSLPHSTEQSTPHTPPVYRHTYSHVST